jgi:hypothetical protein
LSEQPYTPQPTTALTNHGVDLCDQNVAFKGVDFAGVDFNATCECDFTGADLSAAKGVEQVAQVGLVTGSMAAVVPFDFKNSFEDPSQFDPGFAPSPAVTRARTECDVLEDATFAEKLGRMEPDELVATQLSDAKGRFLEALTEEKVMLAAKYGAKADHGTDADGLGSDTDAKLTSQIEG